MSDNINEKIIGLYESGMMPKAISEELDHNIEKVKYTIKKYRAEKSNKAIDAMAEKTITQLLEVKEEASKSVPEASQSIDKLINGVVGLKQLEPQFHLAMSRAIEIANEFLNDKDENGKSNLSVRDWNLIVKTLSEAYQSIYNKNNTVVNVANTNVSAEKETLAFFKSSMSQ